MTDKSSIEQRGLAVITTSGVLVSLLAALAALVIGRETRQFLGTETKTLIICALVSFIAAAALGLAANAPRRYWGLSDEDLDRVGTPDSWRADGEEAAQVVGMQRVAELRRAKTANDRKARLLQGAIAAEVLGVAAAAAAVVVALTS
jgi:hypothetical protein